MFGLVFGTIGLAEGDTDVGSITMDEEFETDGAIKVNEAKMMSDGDMSTVVAGVYKDESMDIVSAFQSITGLKHLRKLIPRMRSPLANSSMTMADIVNLMLHNSNVIITI
jgi:hypothetical protein